MTITRGSGGSSSSFSLPQSVIDILQKVFLLSLIASVGLIGYLIFGLLSGQLADADSSKGADLQHAMQLVNQIALYLDVSLIVTLISAALLFYEQESTSVIMLVIAALLAYGLQFGLDYFGASDRLRPGGPSEASLTQLRNAGIFIAVPGVLLFLRTLLVRLWKARHPDLTHIQFGKNVARQSVPRAPIAAFAKCWQLPYCREGIRVKCPIFHARTKCWKQRIGCMCEENVIRLAGGGEDNKTAEMTQGSGFVPIGDLITKSEEAIKPKTPMRVGPRGVRIPTNPHLSAAQKRQRCENCIIYNEHQRQKYNLFSPLITIAVPLIAFLKYDDLKDWLGVELKNLDTLIAHLKFQNSGTTPNLASAVTDSIFVETMLIVCITLLVITWVLKLLEYCTFKIKI